MWLKWTCFNTSHSLGLIAFSTFYCIKSSEAFRFYSLNAKNAHLLVTERPLKPRIAGVSRCLRSQTIPRSSFHSPQLKVQSWPWKCCRKSYLLGPSGAFFFFKLHLTFARCFSVLTFWLPFHVLEVHSFHWRQNDKPQLEIHKLNNTSWLKMAEFYLVASVSGSSCWITLMAYWDTWGWKAQLLITLKIMCFSLTIYIILSAVPKVCCWGRYGNKRVFPLTCTHNACKGLGYFLQRCYVGTVTASSANRSWSKT